MIYGQEYYEGGESNYGLFGGYKGLGLRFCRFWVYRKAMSILRKHKKQGRLLDLGCAYGFWAGFSGRKGFVSCGCDISGFAVARAREGFPNMDFYEMDIEGGLVFGDNEFDVVTAFDVLEHCRDLNSVLSETRRVLKGEGVLLVTVPDTDFFSKEKDRDGSHVWYMNLKGWEEAFRRNGFRVLGSWVFPGFLKRARPGWTVRFILLGHE
jgi:SAM-dependent methyltransferase